MTTRKDLEDLTKAEIIEMYGFDMDPLKTTKDNLVDLALRAERKKATTPDPEKDSGDNWLGDLKDMLAACTITFKDAGRQVHTVNPGQAHTIAFSGFPEAMRTSVSEWADIGGGNIVVTVDDEVAVDARMWHATERRS